MSLAEYQETQRLDREAERARAERAMRARQALARLRPRHWDYDPPADLDQTQAMIGCFVAAPLTIILGVVLSVAFWLLDLPVWIPVVGTAIGLVGGVLLYMIGSLTARRVLGSLAYRSVWIDRHGEDIYNYSSLVAALLLQPVLTIGATVMLWNLA